MSKFVFVASVVLLASCAPPKYVYYFEGSTSQNDNPALSNRVAPISLLTRDDLSTASLESAIYERKSIVIDTGIVSLDSLRPKKPNTKAYPQSEKEAQKQLYEEKQKAYQEARKAYAATKKKRFDVFAIAAPILFTIAFFSLPYPGVALVFAILGFVASILGFKSRVWGLALGSLIFASVILVFYIYMTLLLGEPPV